MWSWGELLCAFLSGAHKRCKDEQVCWMSSGMAAETQALQVVVPVAHASQMATHMRPG